VTKEELRTKLNSVYIEFDNLVDELKTITKLIDKQKDEIGETIQIIEDNELDA
jgi:hypothetical protein